MRRLKTGYRGGTRGYHPQVRTRLETVSEKGAEHIKEQDEENIYYPTTMEPGPEKDMWDGECSQGLI